jgi:hypothetical protein
MKAHKHFFCFADGLAIVVALFWTSELPQAIVLAANLRTVAFAGQQAPGTDNGVTFNTFDAHVVDGPSIPLFRGPVLNDAGQVAFRADLAGGGINSTNSLGVWSEGTGNLAIVARTGSPAPGGGNFGPLSGAELFSPMLNDAGQTVFYGALTNGDVGVWSEGSGSLALVARDGTAAPGTPIGVSFWFAGGSNLPPLLNNAGQTAFPTLLKGSGVNAGNNSGTWSGVDQNSLALLTRAGSQATGLPDGVSYGVQLPAGLNDAGHGALYAFLTGSGVNSTNNSAIWSGSAGSLALVARTGDPAPGTLSGVNFGALFAPIAINNAGKIAIQSFLAGNVDGTNDEGLWSNVSGSLELIARRGSQASGAPAGVNYGMFSLSGWPVLNDAGQIAFLAGVEGTGVNETNNQAIWSGEMDNLALVARSGGQAPGTGSGVRFSNLEYPALNSSGQIAFRAYLIGSGVRPNNDKGIWATDSTGTLQLIARAGDLLEVAPDDFRAISELNFTSASGNSDGLSSGFNDLGQLVFWARFTDNSEGIFLSSAVAHVPGDFNNDGIVDAADYVVWRKDDATQDGYDKWRANFGTSLNVSGATGSARLTSASSVESSSPKSAGASAASVSATIPEPASTVLVFAGLVIFMCRRRSLRNTKPSR